LRAPHRIRDQMVSSRTRLICQMRGFCLEYGVPIHQGAGVFKLDLPRVIADKANDLTSTMRQLLEERLGFVWHDAADQRRCAAEPDYVLVFKEALFRFRGEERQDGFKPFAFVVALEPGFVLPVCIHYVC
jgi:hypothetical protein